MRPRPNSSGHGDSDSSQSSGEGIELATVPLQLLALRRDHLLGALPTKRSLASMPSARAISPRRRSSSASTLPPSALTRSGFTTASKIRCCSSSSCGRTPARPEDLSRGADRFELELERLALLVFRLPRHDYLMCG